MHNFILCKRRKISNEHPSVHQRAVLAQFFCALLACTILFCANGGRSATNTHPPARCACTFLFCAWLACACTGLANGGSCASSVEDFSAQLCMQKKCKTASNSTTTTTTQQQVNALSAQLPGQQIGMSLPLFVLRRHHLRPTAALLLVRRRPHPADHLEPCYPSTGVDLCPNSVAGANGPKLRDSHSRSFSSLL